MDIVSNASSMRDFARVVHARHQKLALVPTMGALHEGHLSLVKKASEVADTVVVSIFVNPKQFGPQEDFSKYPRDLRSDLQLLSNLKVDCVFSPEPREMYPERFRTFVEVEEWSSRLCGATRPGHFRGVTTVVAKLFHIVSPDVAVFGKKDAQQALIIERMVRDLNFGIEIVTCPIVREKDGLAMSSRNRYLNPAERQAATVLYRSLLRARSVTENGESGASIIRKAMMEVFESEPLARVDYIEFVDPNTLEPVEQARKKTLIALAAFLGSTRLIDNWTVSEDL